MKLLTRIRFDKFDKDLRFLGSQEQECRSFVKQIWELLYVSAAQIDPVTPRAGVIDAAGQVRSIDKKLDSEVGAVGDNYIHRLDGSLCCVSPGGLTANYIATASMGKNNINAGNAPGIFYNNALPGQLLGIQLGTGNTAVAPNDFKLVERLGHGTNAPDAVASLRLGYTTADDADDEVYSGNFYGQLFVVPRQITCTKISTKLFREGAIGDVVLHLVGITPTAAATLAWPEMSGDIASVTQNLGALTTVSPGVMVDWTFATPVELIPGMIYAFYLTKAAGDATNNVHWRKHNASGGISFERGASQSSANSGSTWSTSTTNTHIWELYGTTRAELEYGGSEIRNITVSNPNASFKISRLFYNNSGGAISLQECGIFAAGKRITNSTNSAVWNSQPYPFLIARDVIAPAINLLDTEVLQVTYTPAVTV